MDRIRIKHRLLEKNLTLAEISRRTAIPYDRLVRIVSGYRKPKADELQAIAGELDLPPSALDA